MAGLSQDALDRFVAGLFRLLDQAGGEDDVLDGLARIVIALARHAPDEATLQSALREGAAAIDRSPTTGAGE